VKIRFQADANLDPDICRGLYRREPSIDFETHVGVIADSTPDLEVLKLAADNRRVLVSADVRTMPIHFGEFIGQRESPGIILVPSSRSKTSIIEGLLLVWLNWTPEQLKNLVRWLPRVRERE
jgi:hypothetical protein